MCEKLLPINTWNIIGATEQQDQLQLRLLKVFAEMCKYCGTLDKSNEKIEAIFQVLQVCFPIFFFITQDNCCICYVRNYYFVFRNICHCHHSVQTI